MKTEHHRPLRASFPPSLEQSAYLSLASVTLIILGRVCSGDSCSLWVAKLHLLPGGMWVPPWRACSSATHHCAGSSWSQRSWDSQVVLWALLWTPARELLRSYSWLIWGCIFFGFNLFLQLSRFIMVMDKMAVLFLKLIQCPSEANSPYPQLAILKKPRRWPNFILALSGTGLACGRAAFVLWGSESEEDPAIGPDVFLMPSVCQALCKSYFMQ